MRGTSLCALALLILTTTPCLGDCEGVLPDPELEFDSCTYEHLPADSFVYAGGQLTVTWDDQTYEILETYIVENWQLVSAFESGAPLELVIDGTRERYDLVGWARRLSDGTSFRFLTPIWSARCVETFPPAYSGCYGDGTVPFDCSLTESVDCEGGANRSVTCTGDNNTCSGCSTDDTACCRSSKTTTTTTTSGTKTETVTTEKKSTCPE